MQSAAPFLRIGTRGSPLALAQANLVARLLSERHGVAVEDIAIRVITTTGDRLTDRPLSEAGGKGLFSKEIEAAILAGEVDLGVHSSKDMATVLPDGLVLSTFLQREDVGGEIVEAGAEAGEIVIAGEVVEVPVDDAEVIALRGRDRGGIAASGEGVEEGGVGADGECDQRGGSPAGAGVHAGGVGRGGRALRRGIAGTKNAKTDVPWEARPSLDRLDVGARRLPA